MTEQTLLLLGLTASGTATLGSSLLAGLTLSAAVGGPLLGAVLDRSRKPGMVLAWSLGIYAAGLVIIALSLGHIPAWVSVLIALGAGCCMPAISGGWSSQLRSFVADEHMARASAIDASTFNITGLVGPALAGLIAALFGVSWALVVLVALLAAALPMARSLPRRQANASIQTASFWQDVRSGFGVIIRNRPLLRATITSVVSYAGIGMLWVACPLVGKELFGSANYGGMLMSILSVGALAATAAYAKLPMRNHPDIVVGATTLLLAAALFALATINNAPLALAAMLLISVADGPQLAAVFAVRHREAPERSRSQVFTTGASLKITAAAAGATVAGHLANSSAQILVGACALQFVAVLAFAGLTRLNRRPSAQRA